MSSFVTRAFAVRAAAVLTVVAGTFVVTPAAHAADEFPSYPWATITHSCADQQSVGGVYAITIGNEAGALSSATIHVEVSGEPASNHMLMPGASMVLKGNPGEDEQLDIVVSSGGKVLAELSTFADCITHDATVSFECGEHHPEVQYYANPHGNSGPVVYDLVLPDGSTTQWSVEGMMAGAWNVVEGAAYDVSISSGGVLLDSASGVADCFADDEPDDGPEPTTTTVADDPESEVLVPVTVQRAPTPTTAAPVAPAAAAPSPATLPVTGRSSASIALAGGAALVFGAALLGILRRRTADEL